MMRLRLLLAAALVMWLGSIMATAQVKVWEGVLTLPTYEEGLPDSNPPFEQFSTNFLNYPYTLRENLTSRRADHDWRAVYLENEYLKCSVLPDIGGHLYTCTDKISGQPMFYANPSIKRNRVSYRGSWAAFGIEYNFPVSHNWVTMSPVSYAYANKPDGSASVTVGNIDRVYGMEWSVELILRPGSTVLEQSVTLNNRSDTRHRFYWWNNAGVEVKDDSHIIYPMRFAASHGFRDVETWPVDLSGADLSMVRNHLKGPVSLFVHGSREPFMGVWRPDTRTGTVHYADYAALPAKKIWSWGADADGLDWRKALSDNNSAYVEVQAGLFRNQETYAFLEPRQTIRFSEYWMPVHDMGGFSRANLAGVLNLSRNGQTFTAEFNANRAYPGAVIRVLDQQRIVAEEKADLKLEQTWRKEINLVSTGPITVEVADRNGELLVRHTEGKYDWTPASEIRTGPQPVYVSPAPEQRTESDWAERGKNEELYGKLVVAMATYQGGLAKFPASLPLMKSAGRLASSLSRYDDALKYLEPIATRDTWDPEVAYYLGLTYDGLGRNREARTAYETAARMPEFRVAGGLRLAELLARDGQRKEALDLLRSLSGDLRVAEEAVALENALGLNNEAQALASKTLQSALSPFLAFETATSPAADAQLLRSLAADPDRVLNIAAEYMRLGLYRRALDVLSRDYPAVASDQTEPGAALPQNHPLVAYYRAYCREKLGESADADDALAEKLSTQYVFPSGAVTLDVLLAAQRRNPNSATVQYLLGTQYFSVGLTDAALSSWSNARKLNPRLPVLHASIGRVLLQVRRDPAGALEAFQEGVAADPKNVALYAGMDQALSLLGRPARERAAALERYPDLAAMPVELVYELALNRAEAGDHDGAFSLLKNRFIPRQEFGTNVRQVWIEVKVHNALSLSQTGKCDSALSIVQNLEATVPGFDFTRDGLHPFLMAARTQYLLGKLDAQCGRREQATAHFRRAAESQVPADAVWARRAARELPGYDDAQWRRKLEAALGTVEERLETLSQKGYWAYASGLLNQELGRTDAARTRLTQAVLLPDRMLSLHLSRLAMGEARTTTTTQTRLVSLTTAMINGVHWGQVLLQESQDAAGKGDPQLFGKGNISLTDINDINAALATLLAFPTSDMVAWSQGKETPRSPEISAVVEKLSRYPAPADERLPVNVLRLWMAKRLTGPEEFFVRAVANLGQLSLQVDKDATQLQDLFGLYIALGLEQLNFPESRQEQIAAASELAAQSAKSPYSTDAQAWQFLIAKLANWSQKSSGHRDRKTLARDLLAEPDVKALIPGLRALPPRRVAFLGHSMMMSIHWSTFGSWCDVAAEAAKQVNPNFEYRDFQSGGLTATRAVKEHLDALLAYKPTEVYILVAMRTPGDRDALTNIVSRLTAVGTEVYVVNDIRPWVEITPDLRDFFGQLARRDRVHLLDYLGLAQSAAGHDEWAAIDHIHMQTPAHLFFARETLRRWAAPKS